ncbi:MAG: translation initiation factor IF-3 [Parcubacteria group bacterium]|nr:translation initiation factor IF-3 [Parcubacteria group bacterium]
MRKSHRKKKEVVSIQFRRNAAIKVPEVRLIDEQGNALGVKTIAEALKIAEEQGLDLVEVYPKAVPPVAKLIDYGKFIYQKEKQMQKQKARQKKVDIKGVRLSIRISDHDKEFKRQQAQKFLEDGNKVKIEMILKGREHQYTQTAVEAIKKFIADMGQAFPIEIESPIEKQGGRITTLIYKK